MAINFLFSSINNDNNNLITIFTDKETFLSDLNCHSSYQFNKLTDNYIKYVYFLNKDKYKNQPNAIKLFEDIHRINIDSMECSQFILLINESMLSNFTAQEIETFLYNIKHFAGKKGLCVTLCLYGHFGMVELESKLLTINQAIAGLTTMTSLDEYRFRYLVRFWLNKYGVTAGEEYVLTHNEQHKLQATRYKKAQDSDKVESKPDSHICYITKPALIQSINTPKGMLVADNNQHLLTMIDNPQAATFIFSCTNPGEVKELAINCYQLRVNFGSQLKIVIRETQQCLRYTDEKLLLRAGVNLIVPYQVPYIRFMTQVEAIQGHILSRTLPASLDTLLKYSLRFESKGYLQNTEFVKYCSNIITRSVYSNVDFSLVRLSLLPGMSAEECLRLCHIRRDGDVVTATNNALYVLFSAIRKTDIDTAINNIFEFPVRDLFHSTVTLDTKESIETAMNNIIESKIEIPKDVSSLTTQKQLFTPTVSPSTDVPVSFAVKQAISTQESL
ncbi:cellulose biosynthesis protein BcsE [Vibrio sp. YIC-376]|uniref:cellulose biosynthesis protein BcsE n=1 Tax=Vibrio sp. YIC-376 TaxID=3136162 RepID=UPI00402AFA03